MNKLIISILFIILGLNELKSEDLGTWTHVDSVGYIHGALWGFDEFEFSCPDTHNCIYFIADDVKGNIIKTTTDGGYSWTTSFADTAYSGFIFLPSVLRDMSYPSKDLCIIVGDSGTMLRSTDRGLSWIKQQYDTLINFLLIEMYDDKEGYLFCYRTDSDDEGDTVIFWKTYNGGIDWVEEYRPILNEFRENKWTWALQLQILSKDLGMSLIDVTEDNKRYWKILKIYDDWTSWDTVSRPISYYKHFVDEQTGWLASSSEFIDSSGNKKKKQLIYHTTDGGLTWETQREKFFHDVSISDIKFYDKNFGIAGSKIRWVLLTFDGGKTWNEVEAFEYVQGDFNSMRQIEIPAPNVAYVYSVWPDEILKWTRIPTSVVEGYNGSDFFITPNPASDYIEIQMTNHTLKGVVESVKVFDVLGNVVVSDSFTHPPTPSREGVKVRLDISALAPGVYFVRVGGQVSKFVKM